MSTSAVSQAAAPAPASPSGPPRGARPPHPRPTTYSGPSPSAPHSSGSTSAGTPNGPPIPPPPRTSSKTQTPTAATPPESRAGNSTRGGGDGANDRDRDRDRRRTEDGRTRQDQPPVGRSNSTRGTSSSSRGNSNSAPQQGDPSRSNTRRRQDSESSGNKRGNGGGSSNPVSSNGDEQSQQTSSNRRAHTRKETRFGEYILGQTLGEGEFGKVKLGWRRDGGVQVAIKLIRRDSISPHPNRISKIYREIAILRTLSHPNIVSLREMVETERHIGIILEYASGGELFDYILTHRYLKDPPACRLFAQLVSGVGYLHKKGIVHRDLKLENLLLDRNRNIIITDFGFANVFDPKDELGDLEDRLDDPVIIKELEKGVPHTDRTPDGSSLLSIVGPGQIRRRGDLMATSCGSPCYAAPELVVSDGLYTGRKVDVWSCGVILYAMLAGYLPFDDDPANPEGDNINLLYKYIVSTSLTFPEYVTPHARDLLRRILVPDPRRRADLFEVARHSWLSPFADIVNKVTSATTGIKDVETITVREPKPEPPVLTRSASVREPSSTSHPHAPGALGTRHHPHEQIVPATQPKPSGDNKRRTVQVEYVEPQQQTQRGSAVDPDVASKRTEEANDAAPPPVVATHKEHKDGSISRAATTAGTTRERTYRDARESRGAPKEGPRAPMPDAKGRRPVSYQQSTSASRASAAAAAAAAATASDGPSSNPPTRRPSKDRTGPPVAGKPVTAPNSSGKDNSSGRIAMPSSGNPYISAPILQGDSLNPDLAANRPATQPEQQLPKGHKRANTVGGAAGDSNRFLGKIIGNSERPTEPAARPAVVGGTPTTDPRQSIDQGARMKMEKSASAPKSRRFSLLPTSFSLRSMTGEGKHERKLSRTNSRQYNSAAQNQQQSPQVQSQPQLGASHHHSNDTESAMTGSDTSLAAGSAPASAFGRASADVDSPNAPAPNKKTMLSKHKRLGDAFEGESSSGGHGSSGPARRVMDFFRRRGTARSKGEKA